MLSNMATNSSPPSVPPLRFRPPPDPQLSIINHQKPLKRLAHKRPRLAKTTPTGEWLITHLWEPRICTRPSHWAKRRARKRNKWISMIFSTPFSPSMISMVTVNERRRKNSSRLFSSRLFARLLCILNGGKISPDASTMLTNDWKSERRGRRERERWGSLYAQLNFK